MNEEDLLQEEMLHYKPKKRSRKAYLKKWQAANKTRISEYNHKYYIDIVKPKRHMVKGAEKHGTIDF